MQKTPDDSGELTPELVERLRQDRDEERELCRLIWQLNAAENQDTRDLLRRLRDVENE